MKLFGLTSQTQITDKWQTTVRFGIVSISGRTSRTRR